MMHYNPTTFQPSFNELNDCSMENRIASAIRRTADELMYGDEAMAIEREDRTRRVIGARIRLQIAIREALC